MSAAVASSLLATVFCNSTRLDAAASQLSSLETPLANSKHAVKNISFMKAFMTTSDTKHGIERESVLIKKLLHGIRHLSTGQVGWCVLNAQRCRACQVPNIWLYPNFTSTRTCLKHFIALHISVTSTSKASQPCRMSAPRCNLPPVLSAVLQGVVRQLELCSLAQYVMASYAMLISTVIYCSILSGITACRMSCISTFLCSKRGFRVFLNRLTCRRSRLCSFSAQLQQPKLGQVSLQGLASACRRSPWNPWLPSVWPHLSRVAQNHCSTAHASEEQGDQILGYGASAKRKRGKKPGCGPQLHRFKKWPGYPQIHP